MQSLEYIERPGPPISKTLVHIIFYMTFCVHQKGEANKYLLYVKYKLVNSGCWHEPTFFFIYFFKNFILIIIYIFFHLGWCKKHCMQLVYFFFLNLFILLC